jgi:hypothetical protein
MENAPMAARDISTDLDRLADQLAEIRSALVEQSKSKADHAAHYLKPHVQAAARHIQGDGRQVVDAARRNPGTTGAILGALALGAIAWGVLSSRR